MFSTIELRLIRHAVIKQSESLKARVKILSPESDEAVEAKNDLVMLKAILEKIADRKEV